MTLGGSEMANVCRMGAGAAGCFGVMGGGTFINERNDPFVMGQALGVDKSLAVDAAVVVLPLSNIYPTHLTTLGVLGSESTPIVSLALLPREK